MPSPNNIDVHHVKIVEHSNKCWAAVGKSSDSFLPNIYISHRDLKLVVGISNICFVISITVKQF